MTSNSREPTPQDRLAASRQAIVKLMNAKGESQTTPKEQTFFDDSPAVALGRGAWQAVQRALGVWWRNHPAQLALELGRPVLGKYLREKPLQLLGISAAAGVAVVLLKPWRFVSMTSLAISAAKSSQVSGILLSLFTKQPHSPEQKDHG
jgi:hypothetical protein